MCSLFPRLVVSVHVNTSCAQQTELLSVCIQILPCLCLQGYFFNLIPQYALGYSPGVSVREHGCSLYKCSK